jgi:hypothetical protein
MYDLRVPLLCAVALGGCAAKDDPFLAAVPSRDAVSVTVPGGGGASTSSAGSVGEASQALIGERATFYVTTRDISRGVNGLVGMFLTLVEQITKHPPTARDATHAAWRPITEALSPATYTFAVETTGPSDFKYVLAGKPKAAPDSAYQPLFGGTAHVVDALHGSGQLAVNFSALAALDDGVHASGGMAVTHDNTGEPRKVEVAFHDFLDGNPGAAPLTAGYRYTEKADHSGTFEFGVLTDFDKDGTQVEAVAIVSRWLGTGAGRSDILAQGGSLPSGFQVHAAECWDAQFGRSYYTENVDAAKTEGSPGACALP